MRCSLTTALLVSLVVVVMIVVPAVVGVVVVAAAAVVVAAVVVAVEPRLVEVAVEVETAAFVVQFVAVVAVTAVRIHGNTAGTQRPARQRSSRILQTFQRKTYLHFFLGGILQSALGSEKLAPKTENTGFACGGC